MTTCLHCGKPLKFLRGKGWAHADTGKIYAQRLRTPEELERLRKIGLNPRPDELIDDHCAMPDYAGKVLKKGDRR